MVWLLLEICHIHRLHTKSIDFVLGFPQEELDMDIWMEFPIGFWFEDSLKPSSAPATHLLKLNKSLHGLKQASLNWFEKLKAGLITQHFVPSKIDPCLYIKPVMIIQTYVDECIIISKNKSALHSFIHSICNGEKHFLLMEEDSVDKFCVIEIKHCDSSSFEFIQPFLINCIVNLLGLINNQFSSQTNSQSTPVAPNCLLCKDLEGDPRHKQWKYQTLIGMLMYLQVNTISDISMPVHQAARFSNHPMFFYEWEITRIGQYLLDTRDCGVIYNPNPKKGLEYYVDTNYAASWHQVDATKPNNVMSRMSVIISYVACPLY